MAVALSALLTTAPTFALAFPNARSGVRAYAVYPTVVSAAFVPTKPAPTVKPLIVAFTPLFDE